VELTVKREVVDEGDPLPCTAKVELVLDGYSGGSRGDLVSGICSSPAPAVPVASAARFVAPEAYSSYQRMTCWVALVVTKAACCACCAAATIAAGGPHTQRAGRLAGSSKARRAPAAPAVPERPSLPATLWLQSKAHAPPAAPAVLQRPSPPATLWLMCWTACTTTPL
jgi:hypothetical protein